MDKNLFERSGSVSDDDVLVAFLYTLMRDHVVPGVIERIVNDVYNFKDHKVEYANGYLAQYAQDVASRLNVKS